MIKIYNCIVGQHDWRLVAAAVFICLIASAASIDLYRRARETAGWTRRRWLCFGAAASGLGVWSTHFVAMLAYEYQIERGLDVGLTIASAIIAITLTGAAFACAIYTPGKRAPYIAGPLLSAAIGAMHYTGMAAYHRSALMQWDYAYVAASIAAGAAFSTAMFRMFLNARTETGKFIAAVLLALAIAALHFTAMTALTVVPLGGADAGDLGVSRDMLAFGVIAATVAIMCVSHMAAGVDRRLAARQAEEAERLRALAEELREARDRAEAANRAKSDFLANMSHEIRTPMHGVLGITEVLMQSGLNERQKELASIIHSSGQSLMRVINDILDFSRLEAGKIVLAPESFNLRQMISDLVSMMQARAVEKDIELILRYAPGAPEGVIGDETRLRQVLGNIIGNAIKFTDHGHVFIDVQGRRNDQGAADFRIEVTDTGVGIPPDQIPRMFQKFEQADASRSRRHEGTGLGLAICKELMQLMGGDIGASSKPSEGSTFWIAFSLPVDESVRALPDDAKEIFENVRMLAVDDNDVNRRILAELAQGWGMRAEIVGSAAEARRALERSHQAGERFDIILVDYQMPEEDGDEFVGRAQTDPRLRETPFIMLSSLDVAVGENDGKRGNYAAWLAKPIRASRLMDAIARALNDADAVRLKRVGAIQRKDRSAGPDAAAPAGASSGPRYRVLLAEDNVVNQLVATKMIDAERYEVIVAGNGAAAVDEFAKIRPDLVIMDLSMPVLDGLEATARIRKLEAERGLGRTPVIAATAHVLDDDRARCLQAGMDDFLSKPMRQADLAAMLEKWLPAAAPARLRASA